MRLRIPAFTRISRRVLPRSLLARSLLIVLIPLVLVEAVALMIFYGSHLDVVSRRFSSAVAGEIAITIELLQRFPSEHDRGWILRSAWDKFELFVRIEPGESLPRNRSQVLIGPVQENLAAALRERVARPFTTDWQSDPQSVLIRIQLPDDVLEVEAPRKRLYTGTIYLFVIWLVGSALLLFGIAALFMRNQVRGIRRLATAVEAFGLGREHPPVKPEGATEVRQAASAFNLMQERLDRLLRQRTQMLAGVSHDLRTPITRLRLALAMMPAGEETRADLADMTEDLEEMDRMIGGYLAFVRGVGEEQSVATDLSGILNDVAARARRTGTQLEVDAPDEIVLPLRPDAMRRAVTNLVDNARRHARKVGLSLRRLGERSVVVTVDDDGPGIPEAAREGAFRPFESGAAGGTGLGLTIARDIIRAHGGDITLATSPMGGLRARIVLPV
jgi:two-component system osmolarity sensor histidine kinase EnvZ